MSTKDAEKKEKELERLEYLKQEMRSETESMVEQAKEEIATKQKDIQTIIEAINSVGQVIAGEFEGEASEAAQKSVTKLKSKHMGMNTDFEYLVESFKVY
ncbi:hypothetical protein ACWEX2_05350 [Staphylococcus xylosus]|uniref:Uncharacterized protein n=1 Tax=Staphylococcus xylosus TaxID=1288 RepID=A0AAQ0M026_STAXY|nr:hypothetical protein [Staphylococcus xylosus]MCM3518331.1 hypothetical protein [Staphylococcus xylosus]MCQ3816561.1 hypothetical protein [Staphylococcus xylosus]MCQ3819386.1 hypothetical protein [Staphylococcus xylosus]PTH98322.1 hypothetical protein BU099_08515 [Staphylococcus xylosus]RIM64818.1 hypothetical protein BU122_09310 [Staphylococcus xylosus]